MKTTIAVDTNLNPHKLRLFPPLGRHHLPTIHDDIIFFSILTRLPVKSLHRFKCVSKLWNATISDPNFIRSHTIVAAQSSSSFLALYNFRKNTQPALHKTFAFVMRRSIGDSTDFSFSFSTFSNTFLAGHCNGLFLFVGPSQLVIYNPSVYGKMAKPLPQRPSGVPITHLSYGFGCDPSTNHYKIVRVVHTNRNLHSCIIYTLGDDAWKSIQVSHLDLSPYITSPRLADLSNIWFTGNNGKALYANGTLFWFFPLPYLVMTFCLHTEKFSFFEGPRPDKNIATTAPNLIQIQGCVCLAFLDLHANLLSLYNSGQPAATPGSTTWYSLHFRLPAKPTSSLGILGEDSLLYYFKEKLLKVHLLNVSPQRSRSPDGKCELTARFPGGKSELAARFPPYLNLDCARFACQFFYHIENLLSLEALERSYSCLIR